MKNWLQKIYWHIWCFYTVINNGSNRVKAADQMNAKSIKLYEKNKLHGALVLAENVLKIRKKVLGEEHQHTVISEKNIGYIYKSMGDMKKLCRV